MVGGRVATVDLADVGGPLLVCSSAGELLGASPAARELFAAHALDPDIIPPRLWQLVASVAPGVAIDWRPGPRSGATFGCTRYPLGPDRALLLMREITRIREELAHRLRQHRTESSTRLVELVAHDLRAPLASLVLNVDVLSNQWPQLNADDLARCLDACTQAIGQMRATIDTLLDFARVEQAAPASPEGLPLDRLVERVSGMLRPMLRARGHRLAVELGRDARRVRGNALAIEQILANLVLAVAELLDEPRAIGIASAPTGDGIERPRMVRVTIGHDGRWATPIDPQLFDPAVSARASTVGLCLARDAALACGGSLTLESAPSGARFVVTLPSGELA